MPDTGSGLGSRPEITTQSSSSRRVTGCWRRESARRHFKIPRSDGLYAGPGARIGVRRHRAAPDQAFTRSVAAPGGGSLSSVPPALSGRRRAVRPRRLRPCDQQQSLCREVGDSRCHGHPCLLLPLADALRGIISTLFVRPGRRGAKPALAPYGAAARGCRTAGRVDRFLRILSMLRAGSADTIIGVDRCVSPVIRPFTVFRSPRAAISPKSASSLCLR